MVQEIYINNLEDVFELVSEQKYNNDIDRYRSSFLYRGTYFYSCGLRPQTSGQRPTAQR